MKKAVVSNNIKYKIRNSFTDSSSVKLSDPGHFLKSQGKLFL